MGNLIYIQDCDTEKYQKVSRVKISLVGERMFLKEKIKYIPGEKWEVSPTPRQGVKETCSGKEQDCKDWGRKAELRHT